MSTSQARSTKKVRVPAKFKGKTVWTVPSEKLKQEVPGRFIIDMCSQEELLYLKERGTFDK